MSNDTSTRTPGGDGPPGGHQPMDPTEAFAEIGRINLAESDLQQVLTRVSELAKRSIPGAAEVSVTLLRGQRATTAAYTGDLALHLDEAQYDQGYGPCLDASSTDVALMISDMTTEERWPGYTPRAVEQGAFSSLSVSIPVQEAVTGALNIYSTERNAFDENAVQLGQSFASYAAVAISNAHLYASTAALAQQMEEAMTSRAVIEQAKGILMAQAGCDADQAFAILTMRSQHANRKVRDLAADIVKGAIRT